MAKRHIQHERRPSMSTDSTTTDSTDITTQSKIENLEHTNAALLHKLTALEQTVTTLTEASNPQVLQGHIKVQLDIQAVQLETRFHQIVEDKLGQHSTEMESKLDDVVVMFNNRIEVDAERDRAIDADREATRVFQLMMSNWVAAAGTPAPHPAISTITPTSHTFVETCPTVSMLPGNSDSDSDYEEESVSSSEANDASMEASDDPSTGSSSSENSYDTAQDSQLTINKGGRHCPISIHTDSTEDSSVDASI